MVNFTGGYTLAFIALILSLAYFIFKNYREKKEKTLSSTITKLLSTKFDLKVTVNGVTRELNSDELSGLDDEGMKRLIDRKFNFKGITK